MLALSLLLCSIFAFQATVYLLTRNTSLRPISAFLSFLQPLLIPAILLLTLNLYSSESRPTLPTSSQLAFVWNFLRKAPRWWEVVLRTSSPLFVILEGMSTLLCIQALSRYSRRKIDESRSPDVLQLALLAGSALIYVGCAYFLWEVCLVFVKLELLSKWSLISA